MKSSFILILISVLAFCRCAAPSKKDANTHPSSLTTPRYAHGFRVSVADGHTLIEVRHPYGDTTAHYRYLLVNRGEKIPAHDAITTVITVPLENIVCTSTTHIPLLDYLGETDKLVGFPTTDYISSIKMRARIDAGKITDLGIDKGMNLELLATLRPSLVMGYSMSNELGQLKKIQELGIPVVINTEYLEKHPLGRAEWIKFMAVFFNKEAEADSIFNAIESDYLQTAALAASAKTKPTVMSGIVYGDTWFLPGGKNYASKLLEDAGCTYLWKNDPSSGFLELSFESVYEKAKNAELWIGVGSYKDLAELKAAEERYARFKPFIDHKVYTYNSRKGAKGGSEFLELGYLRPDFILKDLVKIAHPGLLPHYTLFFHEALR